MPRRKFRFILRENMRQCLSAGEDLNRLLEKCNSIRAHSLTWSRTSKRRTGFWGSVRRRCWRRRRRSWRWGRRSAAAHRSAPVGGATTPFRKGLLRTERTQTSRIDWRVASPLQLRSSLHYTLGEAGRCITAIWLINYSPSIIVTSNRPGWPTLWSILPPPPSGICGR